VDEPPAVTITSPADGDKVSGDSVLLSATAIDDQSVTSVVFEVNGSSLSATPDSGVWSATWVLDGVADGGYAIAATATDTGGQTDSHSISVTLDNITDQPIGVAELSPSSEWTKPNVAWAATVAVSLDPGVADAIVTGVWSSGDIVECTTDGSGLCSVTLEKISKKTASVDFTVTDISKAGYAFVPSDAAFVVVPKPE
jgi:hypothetical protein